MEFKETIPWPVDMNGVKLSFGDILYDSTWDNTFTIDHFELHEGLLGPLWYASDDCGGTVNLVFCRKVGRLLDPLWYANDDCNGIVNLAICRKVENE